MQILNVEQMVTSCGGFQDPMGAVFGGVNIGRVSPSFPLTVTIDYLGHAGKPSRATHLPNRLLISRSQLSEEHKHILKEFEDRLVLVYSGKTRLSRNLIQVYGFIRHL